MSPIDLDLEENLSNYLRLANLKNLVNSNLGNRQDREIATMQSPDFSGASQESIYPIDQEPQPGNFDVRANSIIHNPPLTNDFIKPELPKINDLEEKPDEQNVFSKLFNLKNFIPSREKTFEMIHPGLKEKVFNEERLKQLSEPQISQPIPEAERKIEPSTAQRVKSTMHPGLLEQMPSYKTAIEKGVRESPEIKSQLEQIDEAQLQEAAQNPGTKAVSGATQLTFLDPVAKGRFKEITGVDLTPQIADAVASYEKLLASPMNILDQSLGLIDEREKLLRDRLNKGELTTQDKIMMGLALIMPAIAAGIFGGKEAFFGALGGGTSALGKFLTNEEEGRKKNESELEDLALNKANLGVKKAELQTLPLKYSQELQKNLPKNEQTEALKGRTLQEFVSPTGETKEGVEILPDFYKEPRFIQGSEDKKIAEQQAAELVKMKTAVKSLYNATNNIMQLSSQLDDPGLVSKVAAKVWEGKGFDVTPKMGKEVNFNGRKVNAAVELRHQIQLLVDSYRQMKDMRALTQTVAEHIEDIFANPFTTFNTPIDTVNQMISLRDLAQNNFLDEVASRGFIPESFNDMFNSENEKIQKMLNSQANKKRLEQFEKGVKNG